MHAVRPLALGTLAGALLGIAPPAAWGAAAPLPWLAASACLALALTGDRRLDAASGLAFGLAWSALALRTAPGVLAAWGVPSARLATLAGVVGQALGAGLFVPIAGALRSRGVGPGPSLGLAWLATDALRVVLQPLPISPAVFLAPWPALAPLGRLGAPLLAASVWAVVPCLASSRDRRLGGLLLAMLGAAALWPVPVAEETVRVGLVQPEVGAFDGRRASFDPTRRARVLTLATTAAEAGATLVLTPESAWPDPPGPPDSARRRRLADAWRDVAAPVLLGVPRHDAATGAMALLWEGALVGRVDKRIAMPVTEGGGAVPSDSPRTLSAPTSPPLRIAPLVCVEALDGPTVRGALTDDPDMLVLAANDAWTGTGPLTHWHDAAARLVAATAGRPTLRVDNTGPSWAITPDGTVHATLAAVDDTATGRWTVVDVPLQRTQVVGASLAPWTQGLGMVLTLGLLAGIRPPQRERPPPSQG